MEEQTSVPSRSGELLMKLPGSANVYSGRGVMKLCESGGAFAMDMGVLVSKMVESIAAHCQASLKTAQARWVQERSFTTAGERAPKSTVTWHTVSTAFEADQSSFQS